MKKEIRTQMSKSIRKSLNSELRGERRTIDSDRPLRGFSLFLEKSASRRRVRLRPRKVMKMSSKSLKIAPKRRLGKRMEKSNEKVAKNESRMEPEST